MQRVFLSSNYSTSPDGKYAFHAFSSFDDPGIRELVSLPDHRVLRTLGTSEQVKAKMKDILDPPVEYFQVDAGKGVRVDGYMIKPYGFAASKKYPVLVYDQGTELLVNRLVDLGKPFDFMTYPDRTHAISEGPGTTVHLYRLLTRYLTEHLPAGAK